MGVASTRASFEWAGLSLCVYVGRGRRCEGDCLCRVDCLTIGEVAQWRLLQVWCLLAVWKLPKLQLCLDSSCGLPASGLRRQQHVCGSHAFRTCGVCLFLEGVLGFLSAFMRVLSPTDS
jgi:hypothetical protein